MNKPDPTPMSDADWDGALRTLLEEHGIDPDRNRPLTKAQRRNRYLRKSRKTIGLTVAAVAAAWVIVQSGAPAAAFIPLLSWFAYGLARGYWRAAGSPGWRQVGDGTQERGRRALVLLVRRGGHVWYPISRALRARYRALRAQMRVSRVAAVAK